MKQSLSCFLSIDFQYHWTSLLPRLIYVNLYMAKHFRLIKHDTRMIGCIRIIHIVSPSKPVGTYAELPWDVCVPTITFPPTKGLLFHLKSYHLTYNVSFVYKHSKANQTCPCIEWQQCVRCTPSQGTSLLDYASLKPNTNKL